MNTSINRDTLTLLLIALGAGVVIGLLLAGRGRGATHTTDSRRIEDKKRSGTNMVFGNIIIGSNNAPDAIMSFGYDDSGDND